VPVYWAEFPQKIWVNYGIGWSEASDANLLLVGAERAKRVTRTTLQRSGLVCLFVFTRPSGPAWLTLSFSQSHDSRRFLNRRVTMDSYPAFKKYKKSLVTCYDRFEAVEAARRACLLGPKYG
jgi:hypothetical protein